MAAWPVGLIRRGPRVLRQPRAFGRAHVGVGSAHAQCAQLAVKKKCVHQKRRECRSWPTQARSRESKKRTNSLVRADSPPEQCRPRFTGQTSISPEQFKRYFVRAHPTCLYCPQDRAGTYVLTHRTVTVADTGGGGARGSEAAPLPMRLPFRRCICIGGAGPRVTAASAFGAAASARCTRASTPSDTAARRMQTQSMLVTHVKPGTSCWRRTAPRTHGAVRNKCPPCLRALLHWYC